ncbi:hypothetical protein [Sphingobium bisphenolivorans]|uniref:hypothetical protein n=1 Tax=Sphingobium bisphenolivorans TaxID=1335760 RepID=UPI00039FB740|nr:hypothetical protein [Sphingobium bisphenolivorans]
MPIRLDATSLLFSLGVILSAAFATPAAAESRTRLADCQAGSCLVVTGRRADAASAVRINGHAVAAQGKHKWRVSIPIETLRQWSSPYARTITVAVAAVESEALLPIGLLGHSEDLAYLTVRAK